MISNLAHELRQPLSTIESIAFYLEMVLPESEEKALRQVGKLQVLVEQANALLADAIQYLQTTPPKPVAVELGGLLAKCLEEDFPARLDRFRMESAEPLRAAHLDPRQGEHMLRSLLNAAAELSGPEGTVSIRMAATQGDVEIAVTCGAPAIGDDSPQRLFDPFNTHLSGTSGLALASVKRIAERHGGRVVVQTGDEGLTLRVAIPGA